MRSATPPAAQPVHQIGTPRLAARTLPRVQPTIFSTPPRNVVVMTPVSFQDASFIQMDPGNSSSSHVQEAHESWDELHQRVKRSLAGGCEVLKQIERGRVSESEHDTATQSTVTPAQSADAHWSKAQRDEGVKELILELQNKCRDLENRITSRDRERRDLQEAEARASLDLKTKQRELEELRNQIESLARGSAHERLG